MSKSVAIIGGGPVGLAAAAHVLERGLIPIVLEAGESIATAVRQWRHVQLFSAWGYNIDAAAARLLERSGWKSPDPETFSTGGELIDRYLEPLATTTKLKERIRTSSRVVGISRVGLDKLRTGGREAAPFEIHYQSGDILRTLNVDSIIDASGNWFSPNPAGANGLPAIGETGLRGRIAYSMPDVLGRDRARYTGRTTAVLGAGHSAIGTLIDLVRLKSLSPGTEVVWLLRGADPEKAFGGGADDKLSARGALGRQFGSLVASGQINLEREFRVTHISAAGDRLRLDARSASCERHTVVDELVVSTGFRADLSFLRELRISLDPATESPPALAPLIDPNEHSCGTVRPHGAQELRQPETGFYFAGMKSYGRAPTFLMRTGYEQVRSIAAAIAGDDEASLRVDLVLPQTGICRRSAVATGF